jgi:hypothetical protein
MIDTLAAMKLRYPQLEAAQRRQLQLGRRARLAQRA